MDLTSIGFKNMNLNYDKENSFSIARIISEHKGSYFLSDGTNEYYSEISGKLIFESSTKKDLPVTGDWVRVKKTGDENFCIIEEVLPRKNLLSRKNPGNKQEEQPIASNIDGILIVMGLDHNFNLARLERFLTASLEITTDVSIVLTKSDLCENLDVRLNEIRKTNSNANLFTIGFEIEDSFQDLKHYMKPENTYCFIGSSGAGKSTLLNRLLGSKIQFTQEVREKDSKGKHSTTHREIFKLPDGALVIDNPGVREFQFWNNDSGLDIEFSDIFRIAEKCKYRNCNHEKEPDCAVMKALEEGILSESRWKNFIKMKKEIHYQNSLQDKRLEQETKNKWKKINKLQKEFYKNK